MAEPPAPPEPPSALQPKKAVLPPPPAPTILTFTAVTPTGMVNVPVDVNA